MTTLKTSKNAMRWLCCLVAGCMAPSWCSAATVYTFEGQYVAWPNKECVRYLSPSAFPEGSDAETIILEAMALWNIVPASDFLFYYSPLDQDYPIDNFDGYNDTAVVSAASLDPGVLGVTFLVNDGASWFDTDVVFSDSPDGVGYTLETNPSCNLVTSPTPTNGYSLLLIAVHEFGHSLGLGHDPNGDEPAGTPWFIATMNPAYPAGGPVGQENIVEVHTDDRVGLRVLYPDEGTLEPPVAELANAGFIMSSQLGLAIPLGFTPSTLYPGEQIELNSLIENFGSTSETGVEQGFYLSTDSTVETTDAFLGALAWDFGVGDAFAFSVTIDLPADLAPGNYYIGSILDDTNAVAEEFEDNNAAVACDAVSIAQFPPAIDALTPQVAGCGQSYSGPTPPVTHPLNMNPITWTLTQGPPGMTASLVDGVVSWPDPVPSTLPYNIALQATNGAGSTTLNWSLLVPLGDLDGGGTVDLGDVDSLGLCLSGPNGVAGNGCDCTDVDADDDIDLRDVATFQAAFGN